MLALAFEFSTRSESGGGAKPTYGAALADGSVVAGGAASFGSSVDGAGVCADACRLRNKTATAASAAEPRLSFISAASPCVRGALRPSTSAQYQAHRKDTCPRERAALARLAGQFARATRLRRNWR